MTWLVVTVLVCLTIVLAALAYAPRHHACTHGESSVGPVTIQHGHVTGSTVPRTTGCKP